MRRNERIENRSDTETETETKSGDDVDGSSDECGCPGENQNETSANENENESSDNNENGVNEPDPNQGRRSHPLIQRDDPNEESGRDVVGALLGHPASFQRLSDIGATTMDSFRLSDSGSRSSLSTGGRGSSTGRDSSTGQDYFLGEATPGAFWTAGRGVGDLPVWFSRSRRTPRPSPNTVPRVRSHVRLVPVHRVTSLPLMRGDSFESNLGSTGATSVGRMSINSTRSQGNETAMIVVTRNRHRGSFLQRSVHNLFRRQSSLPQAEPLHAEKVVYAIVQDEDDDDDDDEPFYGSWELVVYTTVVLLMGIAVGRFTAPGSSIGIEQVIPEILSIKK
jgi:hypothetical protein